VFLLLLEFIVASALIVFLGLKLAKYGDAIAEKTGLARGWIGVVLLGLVTSLPELSTTISAAVKENAPNLAIGNVFGSNMFNIFIIFILDLFYLKGPILGTARSTNIFSGIFAILITTSGIFSIAINNIKGFNVPAIFNIGLTSIGIFVVYLFAMRMIFINEKANKEESSEEESYAHLKASTVYVLFSVFAILIVAVGIWLSNIGNRLSTTPLTFFGYKLLLGTTFVGSLFIAFATSLPELVVSSGSISLGSIDMALGNLLGSNIFNMAIIFFTDIFARYPILHDKRISQGHVISGAISIMMVSVVILSLIYKKKKSCTFLKLGWDSIFIGIFYILGAMFLFYTGKAIS